MNSTAKIVAFFRVIRIVNSCAVFVATFVGGLLSLGGRVVSGAVVLLSDSGHPIPRGGGFFSSVGALPHAGAGFSPIALASASVSFLAAFGYALNDYYDVRADQLNRPSRPIPSGILSRESVLAMAVLCVVAAGLFALRLGLLMQVILVGTCLLVWLYSARLKRTGLGGNVLVSLLAGSTLLFGGLSVGDIRPALFPAVLAFLVNLPREIVKDVQDLKGDSPLGSRSVASVQGEGFALRLASVFVCVLIVVSFLPYGAGIYNRYYLAIVLLIDALLVWIAVSLWNSASRGRIVSEGRLVSQGGLVSGVRPVSERAAGAEGGLDREHAEGGKSGFEIEHRVETAIRVLKLTMLAGLLAIVLGSL
jgi:geranylgeranylglycerol-phosphate geranylgeranyltransferase